MGDLDHGIPDAHLITHLATKANDTVLKGFYLNTWERIEVQIICERCDLLASLDKETQRSSREIVLSEITPVPTSVENHRNPFDRIGYALPSLNAIFSSLAFHFHLK